MVYSENNLKQVLKNEMPESGKQDSLGEHQAMQMAKLVENSLNNPLMRGMLKFCTAECSKCGRRIEKILKQYSGENQKLCAKCKTAYFMVSKTLDYFVSHAKIDRKLVFENLCDPMWRRGLSSVLEGIAEFGVKKPFTGAAPFLTVWNITRACNLNCKHCYEDAHAKAPDELSTEQAMEAVDKMADAGIAYIAISGGEPLMRADFFQVAERIKEREIALSIATNATLITPEIAKKLKQVKCLYAQVSVDGATAETHNSFRGRDAFEKTLKGIKYLVNEGICVGIACTVTKHNLDEVPQVIDLAEKLGVHIFMHYNFIPTGRGKNIVDLDITPTEREELLYFLASQTGKRKVNVLSTAPQYARVCTGFASMSLTHFDTFGQDPAIQGQVSFLADFVGGCGAGRLYFGLDYNGDIFPCVFIQLKLGNIIHDDLKQVWKFDKNLIAMRDREKFIGNCASCDHRNSCGGCRARSFGYYGDLIHADPGCINNETEWQKLKEEAETKSEQREEAIAKTK